MERAQAARQAGYEVLVLTALDKHLPTLEKAGFRTIHLTFDRRSLSLFKALRSVRELVRVFRRERPAIIHQVAIKPILLGSLAARLAGVKGVVNAVVGGGYLFTSPSTLMRIIRPFIGLALRLLVNPPGSRVIFENKDDLTAFVSAGQVRPEAAVLIRGAGVDVDLYPCRTARNSTTKPLVVLPARLLWDKGIGEFVSAARLLSSQGVLARFALVGGDDPGNRASIDATSLDQLREEGVVEVWGFRSDMPEVLASADIVCLPSYGEGLPKALLEAMAAGLPCVTTDVPGCREAVRHGENGLLVPPRDHMCLAEALNKLIQDPELRLLMGRRGRAMAASEFSTAIVCQQTLRVYQELLSS